MKTKKCSWCMACVMGIFFVLGIIPGMVIGYHIVSHPTTEVPDKPIVIGCPHSWKMYHDTDGSYYEHIFILEDINIDKGYRDFKRLVRCELCSEFKIKPE